MSYSGNPYQASPYATFAIDAGVDERATFITRTYGHLAGAILAFIGLEALVLRLVDHDAIVNTMLAGKFSWLVVMGLYMGAAWLAQTWAQSSASRGMQYAGLGLYIVAEAIIFLPMLCMAERLSPLVIPTAGLATLTMVVALTAIVFLTRKDFSFLRSALMFGSIVGIGLILASMFLGFDVGMFITVFFIALMCGYILYDTSNVLHHYHTDQHVAASLALFASIATLFWYVLQLVMRLQSRD